MIYNNIIINNDINSLSEVFYFWIVVVVENGMKTFSVKIVSFLEWLVYWY